MAKLMASAGEALSVSTNAEREPLSDGASTGRPQFANDGEVSIQETHIGKGVFAARAFPAQAVVGEITGHLSRDSGDSRYCFDLENGFELNPAAPFRFLNHSCEPNCEIDWMDTPVSSDDASVPLADAVSAGGTAEMPLLVVRRLFLSTLRIVAAGEQLTIDYNWPATDAIRCECNSVHCRGWVVGEDALPELLRD